MKSSLAPICVLIAIIASFAEAGLGDCPARLVHPCTCVAADEVVCSNFTDMSALQAVFDNSIDHPFERFNLKESNVMYLSATWLTTKRIKSITVRNSNLTSLFDRVPSTDNVLQLFFLFNVRLLRGLQFEYFKPLKKILSIIVQDVEIKKIGKSFASNVSPSIWRVYFMRTKTNRLEDHAFRPFADMKWFKLTDSRVSTLKRSMFAVPSKLNDFDLSNNRIKSLPDDMFSKMDKLMRVFLNGNRLVTLSPAVFKKTYETSLYDLHVHGNPLMCNCSISWLVFSTRKVRVQGYCSAPADLKGRPLSSLKKEEFQYCPKSNLDRLII